MISHIKAMNIFWNQIIILFLKHVIKKVINGSGVYFFFFSERLKMDNSVTQDDDGGKGHYIDNNIFSMARL